MVSEFEPPSHSVNLHDALSIGFHVFRQDPNLSHTKMNEFQKLLKRHHCEGRWRAYTGEGCGNRDELNEGGSNQQVDS